MAMTAETRALRDEIVYFLADEVVPAEPLFAAGGPLAQARMVAAQQRARDGGLWAYPLPVDLGGRGLRLGDYAPLAEVEGRSDFAPTALGSDLLLDATMLARHGSPEIWEHFLQPMVAGACPPSFAMTEPGTAGSDPSGITTRARRVGDQWQVTGGKWFTTRAAEAGFTTVVCRTDDRDDLSLIVVPTRAPGYRLGREVPVLGGGGQQEIVLDQVRVPASYCLGEPGSALPLLRERLALGRTLRCLRWLGQARRAFELMTERMATRRSGAGHLADRQLLHGAVFDSHAELSAARALTYEAVRAVEAGADPRVAVSTAKVVTARAFDRIVDRAIQIHGAEGLTDDTPLAMMHRTARGARILDGPDELHVATVARRLLARDGHAPGPETSAPDEGDYQGSTGTAPTATASTEARKKLPQTSS